MGSELSLWQLTPAEELRSQKDDFLHRTLSNENFGHRQMCKTAAAETQCATSLSGVPFSSFQSHGIVRISGAVFAADGADCRRHQTESNEGLTRFTFFARTWKLSQQSLLDLSMHNYYPLHEMQIRQATKKYYFFLHSSETSHH